jgi:hypothetical protein
MSEPPLFGPAHFYPEADSGLQTHCRREPVEESGPSGDAADDHEVIVLVQGTGADADTAARELSFAAERL